MLHKKYTLMHQFDNLVMFLATKDQLVKLAQLVLRACGVDHFKGASNLTLMQQYFQWLSVWSGLSTRTNVQIAPTFRLVTSVNKIHAVDGAMMDLEPESASAWKARLKVLMSGHPMGQSTLRACVVSPIGSLLLVLTVSVTDTLDVILERRSAKNPV